jgi:hypothetical protein
VGGEWAYVCVRELQGGEISFQYGFLIPCHVQNVSLYADVIL